MGAAIITVEAVAAEEFAEVFDGRDASKLTKSRSVRSEAKRLPCARASFVVLLFADCIEAMACAMKVRFLIEVRFDASLTLDETAYIALHIARLCTEIAAHPSGDKTPGSA